MAEERAAPLTRRDITGRLAQRLGLSASQAHQVLESFLAALAGQMEAGGPAVLSGLGRFYVKNDRLGRPKPAFALSRALRALMKDHGRRA